MNKQISFYEQKLKYETDSWDLYESLERGEKVIVIDSRAADGYENEHIPTAVNIPHGTTSAETTADQLNFPLAPGVAW